MDVENDRLAGAILRIDLDAIVGNYRAIERMVAPARMAAVVKANAYGLGAERVAEALSHSGCRDFCVAQIGEAPAVIASVDPKARVYILNGLPAGAEGHCADIGAIPVLNSLDQISRWNGHAKTLGRRLRGVIQIDSGMGRFGLSPDELARLATHDEQLSNIDVILVMSHLACAEDSDAASNETQRQRFEKRAAQFSGVPRSLSNSAGTFLGTAFHNDVVRAGIALYGISPRAETNKSMMPVVSLVANIVQVRTVPAGDGLGYGLTASADHDRRVAAISVGYADGWPRRLDNRGSAYIAGQRVSIVGRISMDSLLLDCTALPESDVRPGTPVELLGASQSVADVARDADTIPYEILTQFGARYARQYCGGVSLSGRSGMQ